MLYSSIKSIISTPPLSHLFPIHQIYHLYPLYRIYKKQKKGAISDSLCKRLAATYFSTNQCSIIGDERLNFSVRNGKR